MEKIRSDPRYLQGRDFMKAGEYERAIEFFGQLLEVSVSTYGEMAPELACVYLEYGAALLAQSQEATDVFGAAIKDAQKAKQAEAKETGAAPEAEEQGTTEEELQEDLELAWQNLELARVLFTSDQSKEGQLMLAEVYLKLADLNTLNGNFTQAIEDYGNALRIREGQLEPSNRLLAEVHFNLASAYEYYFAAEKEKNPEYNGDQQLHALTHYQAVEVILKNRVRFLMSKAEAPEEKKGNEEKENGIVKGKGKGKAKAEEEFVICTDGLAEEDKKEVEEIKEILEEVKETVEAKQKEVAEGTVSVKENTPQTTIGFGQPSSEQPAANVLPVSTMQVKRKNKEPHASSNGQEAGSNASSSAKQPQQQQGSSEQSKGKNEQQQDEKKLKTAES